MPRRGFVPRREVPTDPAKDSDHPVQNPQGAFHFCREVHMPWRVNDVDAEKFAVRKTAPVARSRRCDDGDAALFFLRHPVHRRRPFVHAANAVDASRVKQDALRRRRLARIYVGGDPDVTGLVQRKLFGCHRLSLRKSG